MLKLTRSRFTKIILATLTTVGLLATPAVAANAADADTTKPSGFLHTSGSKILTADNKEYVVKAVSWFGMETSNCAPHGLWQISLDSGLKKIKDAGFNTIRLPYSNECITSGTPNSINQQVNPTLQNKTTLQIMDTFIDRSKAFGLNIILDRHRPDSGSQSELWYTGQYSENKWINDWKNLATRYKNNPTVIGVDLHNEPHGQACWGCGDTNRDWVAAATKAGNAVQTINPKLLIIVEGVERQNDNSSTWWGGGLADVKKKPIKLTTPNQVVYSPHDYPSTVYNQTWFNASNYPNNLSTVWDKNWGYIQKENIAPIWVGEFGTKYQTDSDKKWLNTLVDYIKTNKMSYAYWSFNPNSGDTGGIMKDDWTTYETDKLQALKPILNGGSNTTPTTPVPSPTPTVTPKPTPVPTSTPKPTQTPTPVPTSTPKPTPTPTTPPTTPPSTKFKATYGLQTSWDEGYVAEITVTGKATSWETKWSDPKATSVVLSWGMNCSLSNKIITCKGADWGVSNLQYGQTVKAGIQVTTTGSAPTNPTLTTTYK